MDSKDDFQNSSEQNSVDDLIIHQENPVNTQRKIKKKATLQEKPKLTAINFRKGNSNGPTLEISPKQGKKANKVQSLLKIIDNKISGIDTSPEQSRRNQAKKMMDNPVIESNIIEMKKNEQQQYSVPKYSKRQQKRQDMKIEALSRGVKEKPQNDIKEIARHIREEYKQIDQTQEHSDIPKPKKRKERKKPQSQVNKLDNIAKRYGIYSKMEKNQKLNRPKQLQPIVKQPERQVALKAAKQFLSGKVSSVWIFVIKQELSMDDVTRIKRMYSASTNPQDDTGHDKYVPLCKNSWEIQELLQVPNCLFKIVTDLNNAYGVFKYKSRKQIVQFYIYNNQGKNGFTHALSYKCGIRKVKGIQHSLQKILNKAEQEVENELQMYKLQNGLIVRKSNRKFPSFLRLSGIDKTQATLYRSNLYGALKISVKQKQAYFNHFMILVQEKYDRDGTEGQNIRQYEQFDHKSNIHTLQQSSQVVKFYIKQSFYYSILNSMLRTMKTTEQFKPCVLPFNETYHAIKMFYQKDLLPTRVLPKMTLYRGTRLKLRDFLFLKPGVFIEMFGFMSTSKKEEQAKKFAESADSYMFVIHVNETTIPQEFDKYDHGFIDVNNHKLAGEFSYEEQVLFNALNIFRVMKVQQSKDYHYIHLQYGVIFDLLKKKKNTLTVDEKDVLVNYKYCMSLQDKIEDQGDVYLLALEYEESKKYYENKIKEQQDNGNAYLKLANVQHQCGQIQQAEKNAQISLEKTMEKIDKNDKQTSMKVFGIHTVNAEINLEKEDFLTADESLEKALEMLEEGQDDFERAKKFRQLGQIKFKKGQIKQAQNQLAKSEEIFINLMKQISQKKWDISKNYYKRILTFLCLGPSLAQIEHQREQQMKKVQEIHEKALQLKDQINMELLKLSKAQQDVYEYAEDKQQYQKHVKKALSYLANIKAQQTKDPFQKAHFNVVQATVQGYIQLAQSEKLLNEAISLIESSNPYDPKVAEYSEILAKAQKAELQKLLNPNVMNNLFNSGEKIPYNQQERKQCYNRCKENYQKALNVLKYNNKSQVSNEVLSIKNEIIELDFNESNYKSCEEIIQQTKELANKNNIYHTEVAKANYLLTKIFLSKGETKRAFQALEEAYKVLRKSLVKKQQQKYILVFEKSEHHLSILILKSKVYQKQMKYDLALIQIKSTQNILRQKLKDQYHTLFAQMYEEYASYLIGMKNVQEFDEYYEKALDIRTQQMGAFNLPNAICRANYAVQLLLTNDVLAAEDQLKKSVQIFSRLSEQNPVVWVLEYTNGIFSQYTHDFQQATVHYEKSLDMAERKLDQSHISISKIQFLIGKSLVNENKFEQAYQVLEDLQGSLTTSLRESNFPYEQAFDDQRLSLTRNVYKVLTDSSIRQSLRSTDIRGSEAANQRKQIYQQRMSLLKKTYHFLD